MLSSSLVTSIIWFPKMSRGNRNANDVDSGKLVFEFASPEAAAHFKSWLCESGEQDYWNWMEVREEEEDSDITGCDFDYWSGDVVKVKCGRITKKNP